MGFANDRLLIPSEFFKKTYQFSDNSANIYEAKEHFLTSYQGRSIQRVDATHTAQFAERLLSFCLGNLEISKNLLVLVSQENNEINQYITDIWDNVIKIAKQSEDSVQDVTMKLVDDVVDKMEKITQETSLSPLPPDLQINPVIEQVVQKYFTDRSDQSVEDAFHLIEKYGAQEVLKTVKYVEHQLIEQKKKKDTLRGSYELRTLCCAKSKGEISTAEAYTYSLDPKLYADRNRLLAYLKNEAHFIPERHRDHYVVLLNATIEMMNMSRRYNDEKPTIYAVRGNTATGKTFACNNDHLFKKGLVGGEATGALNPDTVKSELRKNVFGITNQQIHNEGAAISEKLIGELKKKAINSSLVLDARLAESSLVVDLTHVAKSKQGDFKLLDIEAPLLISCCRVLKRNIKKDPCVPFLPIVNGYLMIRKNRENVLKEVETNPVIVHYNLMVTLPDGTSGVAAIKKEGKFEVVNQSLFEASIASPSEAEIQAVGNRIIDQALIEELQKASPHEKWDHLNQFKGKTIQEALDARALEVPS